MSQLARDFAAVLVEHHAADLASGDERIRNAVFVKMVALTALTFGIPPKDDGILDVDDTIEKLRAALETLDREVADGPDPGKDAGMNYPVGWPRCDCGKPVLDGHLTCGEVTCSETDARFRKYMAEAGDLRFANSVIQRCTPGASAAGPGGEASSANGGDDRTFAPAAIFKR